jgi:hypothetical protein
MLKEKEEVEKTGKGNSKTKYNMYIQLVENMRKISVFRVRKIILDSRSQSWDPYPDLCVLLTEFLPGFRAALAVTILPDFQSISSTRSPETGNHDHG